jgi:hypothetical protein
LKAARDLREHHAALDRGRHHVLERELDLVLRGLGEDLAQVLHPQRLRGGEQQALDDRHQAQRGLALDLPQIVLGVDRQLVAELHARGRARPRRVELGEHRRQRIFRDNLRIGCPFGQVSGGFAAVGGCHGCLFRQVGDTISGSLGPVGAGDGCLFRQLAGSFSGIRSGAHRLIRRGCIGHDSVAMLDLVGLARLRVGHRLVRLARLRVGPRLVGLARLVGHRLVRLIAHVREFIGAVDLRRELVALARLDLVLHHVLRDRTRGEVLHPRRSLERGLERGFWTGLRARFA